MKAPAFLQLQSPVIPSEKERWQLLPSLPQPQLLQRVTELTASQAAVGKRDFLVCSRNKAKTRSWEVVLAVEVTGRKKIHFLRGNFFRNTQEEEVLNLNGMALCFEPNCRKTFPVISPLLVNSSKGVPVVSQSETF